MLKRLELRNFKSWRAAEVDFGRITGLFGVNSSGKSSLAQFLLLLKQTRETAGRATTLELNGRFVQLGNAADVVHAHDESRTMTGRIRQHRELAGPVHGRCLHGDRRSGARAPRKDEGRRPMRRWTIDTNVPVVANGRDDQDRPLAPACREASILFLRRVLEKGERIYDTANWFADGPPKEQ